MTRRTCHTHSRTRPKVRSAFRPRRWQSAAPPRISGRSSRRAPESGVPRR